jgi:hypothetical protein
MGLVTIARMVEQTGSFQIIFLCLCDAHESSKNSTVDFLWPAFISGQTNQRRSRWTKWNGSRFDHGGRRGRLAGSIAIDIDP